MAGAGDRYAEGWLTGFWHYGWAEANPFDGGAWTSSGAGPSGRTLADGIWNSWTFESPISFSGFAANPQAAPSPYSPGDYNRDREIDAADYNRWKSLYGSTIDPSADGNFDGIVSAADYTIWRNNLAFGAAATTSWPSPTSTVPEPAAVVLVMLALVFVSRNIFSNGRRAADIQFATRNH
jgi:hypothetical protein